MPPRKSIKKVKKSRSKVVKKNKRIDNGTKTSKKSPDSVQINLVRDVVQSSVGEDAVTIVDILFGKKNVNEFTIAEKLKITINQTRNLLYKLSDEGLVSFVRKKDKKNGGWYTYFWTFETTRSLENLKTLLEKRIKELERAFEIRKEARFYHCPNCDVEFSEEDALHNYFACPECGDVLHLKDNEEVLGQIRQEIDKLKKDLDIANEEFDKMVKKEDAAVMRKLKREEKKKKAERAARRKKREREMEGSSKKTGKKTGRKEPKKGKKGVKKTGKKKPVMKIKKSKKPKSKVVKREKPKKGKKPSSGKGKSISKAFKGRRK